MRTCGSGTFLISVSPVIDGMNIRTEVIQSLMNEVSDILSSRRELVWVAVRQRAKFEGWLKFELVHALEKAQSYSNIRVEEPYLIGSNKKADVAFTFHGRKCFLQLKTCNTNWRVGDVEIRTRPITRNIKGVIDDIEEMRKIKEPELGIALMVLFPVNINKSLDEIANDIRRIKNGEMLLKACSLSDKIPIHGNAGLAIFLF